MPEVDRCLIAIQIAPKGTEPLGIAIVGSSDRSMPVDGFRDYSDWATSEPPPPPSWPTSSSRGSPVAKTH